MFRPFLASIRLTLLLAVAAVGAWLAPGVVPILQYDRAAVAHGEIYRLLTGHLTHWTPDHLLWDAVVFLLAGAACERGGRRRYAGLLAASAAGVSAAVWVGLPAMQLYRGLSGIDTALVAFVVITRLRVPWAAAGIGLIGAKVLCEAASGGALFVDAAAFTPVPLAHAAGLAAGVAFGAAALAEPRLYSPFRRRIRNPSSSSTRS